MEHADLLALSPEEKKAWFKQATITHRLLEQTDRAVMRVIREHGGFAYVFVFGPSGAGKTTMIHQVSQRLNGSIPPSRAWNAVPASSASFTPVSVLVLETRPPEGAAFNRADYYRNALVKLGETFYEHRRFVDIGANGYRTRLWKVELQRLADETGLAIQVCHFPLGTSKWNKIEHRLFSFITINWRGKPLTSLETIVNLIASTTTRSGLKVFARLDEGSYPADLHGHAFHPDWNYTIEPRVITWRRLTLHVEAAATATACFPVANFVRHGSREVDCTPRSEVLD